MIDTHRPYPEVIEQIDSLAATQTPFLFAVDFEKSRGFILSNPFESQEVLFQIGSVGNAPQPDKPLQKQMTLQTYPEDFSTYKERFGIVQAGMLRGDSFLCNLTVATPIETNLTLQEMFFYSKAPYKLYVPGEMVCFSPERFIYISPTGRISTNPMKGTIDASIPNAKEVILSDYKETAEHNTIVDLLRNDLNTISTGVQVDRFRYIDTIRSPQRTILQVSSEVSGQLPSGYKEIMGRLIDSLLPAGSISGAPKQATLKLIEQAEKLPRGYYTGVFGYWDGTTLDTAVMIRFIEQRQDGHLFFRSGGGITINSDCRSEYEEVMQKVYIPLQ